MKHQTGKRFLEDGIAVERVADNRMAEAVEVNPNLMAAARKRMRLNERR